MKKNRSAFTLLELLIAVAIFSIIATVLYSSFSGGIRILRRTQALLGAHQDLRFAMTELSLDLHNSLLIPLNEPPQDIVIAEGEKNSPAYYFTGKNDSFTFVTLKDSLTSDGRQARQICNVTYYLDGAQQKTLMRIVKYQGKGFAAVPGGEEALLGNIDRAEILYSYESNDEDSPPEWLNFWEEEKKVPLGVKLKLRLNSMGKLRDFTKTVLIPVGALGMQGEEKL